MKIEPNTKTNRLLLRATKKNQIDLMEKAMEEGADIHAKYQYGSLLMKACRLKHYEAIRLLVRRGAKLFKSDHGQEAPFESATRNDPSVDMFSALLDCEASPKAVAEALLEYRDDLKGNVLWGTFSLPRLHVFTTKSSDILQALLKAKSWDEKEKEQLWFLASRSHIREQVVLDVLYDHLGSFPFEKAPTMIIAHAPAVILENGADRGDFKVSRLFKNHNSNRHLEPELLFTFLDKFQFSVEFNQWLFDFAWSDPSYHSKTLPYLNQWVRRAIKDEGSKNFVQKLHEKTGVSLSELLFKDNDRHTLLHDCLKTLYDYPRYKKTLIFLLEQGADIHAINKEGKTAIDLLVRFKLADCSVLDAFVKAGADFKDPEGDRAILKHRLKREPNEKFERLLAQWDSLDAKRQIEESTPLVLRSDRRNRL